MPIHNPILPLAGWGLLVLGATSYPNNSAAETKPALQIEHDAVNDEVNLSFEASQTDRYYLLEGRSSLDDLTGTDWRVGYGVKGDGTPRKTPMPMPTDTGFYRLLQVDQDSPRLQIDYDGDRVTALEELNRGLDAFEQSPDDRDGDFIPSDFEVIYGLDPQDPSDALIDDDRDGINNVNEYRLGDDPHTEEADRFTLSVYVEQKVLHHGCETYIQESSPLYSYRHQTGQARTSGHLFYNLLSDCGSQRDRNEWKIDTKGWEWRIFNCSLTKEYLRGVNFEVVKESGFYQILNCVGSPMTFLIEHDEHLLVDMGRQSWTQPTENTETSYEVAHWDGRQLTIDGAPIALPTGRRGCKYTYGDVRLPYQVDLDILHPASGRLREELEDKDYDSSGGYVALKREIDGEDVAPVTKLVFNNLNRNNSFKRRLKFDSGGRYRIYKDADRTEAVVSEQTEFTAGTETTVYLQGLSVSDSLGGEKVTLQAGLSGNWYATDSVNFTVYKVDLISPAGNKDNDPVSKPIDGGNGTGSVPNGANEFTFSTAADGVLTIQFKAEVGGGSTVLNAIKDKVTFTIEDVGQAPTWDAANLGGKASVSGNYLVATATFTGLPANNSDFGKKKVQVLFDGNIVEESEIEVFFSRGASNHPDKGSGVTPNWFYYWSQLPEAQGHNLKYGGAHAYLYGKVTALFDWSYLDSKDKTEIVMYDNVVSSGRSYGVGILLSGVDNFIGTVIHEAEHVDQIARADALLSSGDSFQYGWSWNQPIHNHWSEGSDGEWGVSGVDDDNDSIIDNAKAMPRFEPGNGDDINLDHPSYPQWPNAWPLPSPNSGPHPIESEAINATDNNYSEHKNARNDWADSGKNHKTKDKWND